MDSSFILNEKTLKNIPSTFIFLFVLLLGLPAVAIHYFGVDASALTVGLQNEKTRSIVILVSQIRGYFVQVLLEWSAFSLSAITVLLAFTQYRLAHDKMALLIALAVLFSGITEAFHILTVDGLTPYIVDRENIDALAWTFTNAVSGIILLLGLLLFVKNHKKSTLDISTTFLLAILLILIAMMFIYYLVFIIDKPEMWYKEFSLSRPYELIYLVIYLGIILFAYPAAYKVHPNILTHSIFFMSVTQIATALYLMALSTSAYDSAYNIAYFLKIIFYFIPLYGLILNYVYSYEAVLKAQGRLKYLAGHDPLTELYNRREFENILEKNIANSSRKKESFALFLIDIDNFKSINDSLGHVSGDIFLKQFSAELGSLIRKGDTLSRIGGDEFTIITSSLRTYSSATKLAQRIIKEMHKPYIVNKQVLNTPVSIGIAIYPDDGKEMDELLKHADIAMYNAKQAGKDTFSFYKERLNDQQYRASEIESQLRCALQNHEFSLHYQPIYDLTTCVITGAEVLLRWNNPTLGSVPPDEFISIAESSNLIVQISYWVLEQVCIQASVWMEKYQKQLFFSINISPAQFNNDNFYPYLKSMLEKYKYPGQYLGIEITENLLLLNPMELQESLTKIKALGVNIALDDFGIGYSSLNRLKSLPINILKIDKFFVADIRSRAKKVVLVDAIINLANELGMEIIAEGIETKVQLEYLRSKHCSFGQGFYLNKPMPAADFEQLVFLDKDKQK